MTCNICCDNFNKSTRTKVVCPYCNFETCRSCCETYMLNETIPKCMNPDCGKEWSRNFLRKTFTNVFLNSKYKKHVEEILFSKEKSLMPATQYIVEDKIRRRNIKNECDEIEKQINELRQQQIELWNNYNAERYSADNKTNERREFVRQCPANECRGFLSLQWKCGICEQWTCPDCHEVKGLKRDCEHTCDPNSVETAKLLAKDSRGCPKCQSLIFKIDGCDQMWCTQCHTAFSWKTGNIESNIHNPHYYEWLRKNGSISRNLGDIECGREINHNTWDLLENAVKKHSKLFKLKYERNFMNRHIKEIKGNNIEFDQYITFIQNIIRKCIHNRYMEISRFENNYLLINQELRIKYLENLLTEDEFKQQIQRNDKKEKKNREIQQAFALSFTVLTDIIYRLINHLNECESNKYNLIDYLHEISELRNYCNSILKDIAFTYNSVQYTFGEAFEFGVERENNSVITPTKQNKYLNEI